MEPDLVERCRTVDPAVLGPRVRRARVRRGLTQAEVAGEDMSTAYVSRIEAGQRRPDPSLLQAIAGRLGASVEELLTGVAPDRGPDLRTRLAWVELALTTGDATGALAAVEDVADVLGEAPDDALPDVRRETAWLRARCLEATGDLDGAILALEDLADDDPHGLAWLRVMTALSRCYRESGDLGRAIEVGERAGAVLTGLDLGGSEEGVALTVTVAAAHVERGDVAHGARMCRRAIDQAERLDSPTARASAYWNASVIESGQGRAASALPLALRAVQLLEEGAGGRNLARLRSQLGLLRLDLDPPEAAEALADLQAARVALETTDASVLDVARNQLGVARAHLMLGDAQAAADLARATLEEIDGRGPLLAAEAHLLLGEVAMSEGHVARARTSYQRAVLVLSGLGADRHAAQLWFELGGRLEGVGETELALDAYRRAGASTGLRSSATSHPVR